MARGKALPLAFKPQAGPDSWPTDHQGMIRAFLTTSNGLRISANELARRSGVAVATISLFLHGRRGLSLRSGLLVARALGISPWRVLEYTRHVRALMSPEQIARAKALIKPRTDEQRARARGGRRSFLEQIGVKP